MCTHFRSYLRGAQFTLCTDHCSLRWLQKFWNSDGLLARWYMLLGQFSVTFEYQLGAQHTNVDGLSSMWSVFEAGLSGVIAGGAGWGIRFDDSIAGPSFCLFRHGGIQWMLICCLNYRERCG